MNLQSFENYYKKFLSLCQIDRLKKRYDTMQAEAKKTGSVLYFEPLCLELNDCFGALKDVRPDQVFSNRQGMQQNEPAEDDVQPVDGPQPSTSNAGGNTEKPATKKKSKCNSHYYIYLPT